MDPIIGTIILFGSVLLGFFGPPLIGLFIFSLIGNLLGINYQEEDTWPANIRPKTVITLSEIHKIHLINIPITIKKIVHKGKIVWVDA